MPVGISAVMTAELRQVFFLTIEHLSHPFKDTINCVSTLTHAKKHSLSFTHIPSSKYSLALLFTFYFLPKIELLHTYLF